MSEQSQIPAPTPGDDVIPYQERVEFVADQRIAQALAELPEPTPAFSATFANPTGDVNGLVGVLPKIFDVGDHFVYGGLVTIDHAPTDAEVGGRFHTDGTTEFPSSKGFWYLLKPTAELSNAGYDDSPSYVAYEVGPYSSGVYLAMYEDDAPPLSFPEGWTFGNTTGEGPVLPDMGEYASAGFGAWAGLAYWDGGGGDPITLPANWNAQNATAIYSMTAINDVNLNITSGVPQPAGVYLLNKFWNDETEHEMPPTELPEGWTIQPYGVGAAGPVLAALAEVVVPENAACHMIVNNNTFRRSIVEIEAVGNDWADSFVTAQPAAGVITCGIGIGSEYSKVLPTYFQFYVKKIADATGAPISGGATWVRELEYNEDGYGYPTFTVLGAGSGGAGYADSGDSGISVTDAGWYEVVVESLWKRI